ncbi:unnamed protein product [Pedinophyceae sp. YPF-701]|nr:unnamed protein product [Pedinophyceae sp. YPF-701]
MPSSAPLVSSRSGSALSVATGRPSVARPPFVRSSRSAHACRLRAGSERALSEVASEILDLIQAESPPEDARARARELLAELTRRSEGRPFHEAALAGKWEAVYTQGPVAWRLWGAGARAMGKRDASFQQFEPDGRLVENSGELAGGGVMVRATGRYEPREEPDVLPRTIVAYIEQGAVEVPSRGWTLPLPIRGKGSFEVAYVDQRIRVFRSPLGSLAVQVPADRP